MSHGWYTCPDCLTHYHDSEGHKCAPKAPRQERPKYCPDCGVEYRNSSWACLYPYRHPAR